MATIYGSDYAGVHYGTEATDYIYGGGGDDWIYGLGSRDLLHGNSGHDRIFGGAGEDYLDGGTGNDSLSGGEDDDVLRGGEGIDTLLGGSGDDVLDGGAGGDILNGGSGRDMADYRFAQSMVWVSLDNPNGNYGHAAGDQFISIEDLQGSPVHDLLQGDQWDNGIWGQGGGDAIWGLGGSDTIHGGSGNDLIDGGTGSDALYGGTGDDEIIGGTGNDVIAPEEGNATVSGGAGEDTLVLLLDDEVAWSVDLAAGTASRKKPLVFKPQPEQKSLASILLPGMGGALGFAEMAAALTAQSREAGMEMNSWLEAAQAGMMDAVEEDRVYLRYDGGDQDDTAPAPRGEDYDTGFKLQPVDLFWRVEIDGIEHVVDGNGNDVIRGDGAANILKGLEGNDLLDGRGGNDVLVSDGGTDVLVGGAGDDRLEAHAGTDHATMTGGAGADTFAFYFAEGSAGGTRGLITDFEAGDMVEIHDATDGGVMVFVEGAFSGAMAGGEVRIAQAGGTAVVEVDSDGDGTADWSVDVVLADPAYALSAADIAIL
ncbi:hypothetical protein HKCCE2091_04865 [Rhodobacterales bacterium HKCCE2091]|nr:hypothetical protein [Rhodobacterales bacterium HKCCE2091]